MYQLKWNWNISLTFVRRTFKVLKMPQIRWCIGSLIVNTFVKPKSLRCSKFSRNQIKHIRSKHWLKHRLNHWNRCQLSSLSSFQVGVNNTKLTYHTSVTINRTPYQIQTEFTDTLKRMSPFSVRNIFSGVRSSHFSFFRRIAPKATIFPFGFFDPKSTKSISNENYVLLAIPSRHKFWNYILINSFGK